jgi:CPA1 family monovalent cation:H+ antiporter
LIRILGLDRLTPQEQILQRQTLDLSVREIEAALQHAQKAFRIDAGAVAAVAAEYRHELDIGAALPDLATALTARDQVVAGLISLATRERDLIPEYGQGVINVHNLDSMMRNAGRMVEAARAAGRIGYQRAARAILDFPVGYRFAQWLHRRLHLDWPLAMALTQRFELVLCRRAVLERLLDYNRSRLAPVLGERLTSALDAVVVRRIVLTERAIRVMHEDYGPFIEALQRRLLLLYALKQGRSRIEALATEQVISREVSNRVCGEIDRAWKRAIRRPTLRTDQLNDSDSFTRPKQGRAS